MLLSAGDPPDLATVLGRAGNHGPDVADRGPTIAPALARAIIAVVFCGFAGIALLWVGYLGKSAGEFALAVICLSGLLGLQYFYFCRPSTKLRSLRSYAMLAAQACLAYLPLAVFGQAWVSQPAFVAGSVLLVFAPPLSWLAYAAVVAGTGTAQFFVDDALLDVVYIVVNTATAGLYVYGLTRLGRLVSALHEAREDLAKAAVAHERFRFARDLHDLLGLSLSAIAPRGELALRLLARNPEKARQELLAVLDIARRALADLRSMARLYRETSLDDETGSLASMLAASHVELRVDLDPRALPPAVRTRLAAALREGVAYVLRQREVAQCEIVLRHRGDSVAVEIVHDGTGGGDGFADLAATMSRMAGELTAPVDPDGRSHLQVTLPASTSVDAVDEPGESIPQVATKLAAGLVVAVLCGLFLQAIRRVSWATEDPAGIALNVTCLLAALVLQLAYFSRPGARFRSPTAYLLLGLLVLVSYLPGMHIEVGLVGFLAASALLVLRPVLGWGVFVAVIASVVWVQLDSGFDHPRDGGLILVALNVGLITYGLTWMARSVRQLRAARRELAAVALAETRLRFAQDLHDLLGLSLSAITLKSELAYRLLLRDPARAGTALAEMVAISRLALADVRSVAGGYHEMSLAEECRTAQALLTTAGLDVRMDLDHADLPAEVSTALATVLREGVTNVLRHSKGERCEISIRDTADGVCLHVVNDGVTDPPDGDQRGSGIRNMSDRVSALGGVLTAGYEGAGSFGLRARIPRRPGAPPADES